MSEQNATAAAHIFVLVSRSAPIAQNRCWTGRKPSKGPTSSLGDFNVFTLLGRSVEREERNESRRCRVLASPQHVQRCSVSRSDSGLPKSHASLIMSSAYGRGGCSTLPLSCRFRQHRPVTVGMGSQPTHVGRFPSRSPSEGGGWDRDPAGDGMLLRQPIGSPPYTAPAAGGPRTQAMVCVRRHWPQMRVAGGTETWRVMGCCYANR
jgi:hypothetical protein